MSVIANTQPGYTASHPATPSMEPIASLRQLCIVVLLALVPAVSLTPIPCPDVSPGHPSIPHFPAPPTHSKTDMMLGQLKRDLILKGELSPEACCPYGRCKGDVVVAMI